MSAPEPDGTEAARALRRVAILGAGTMGAGIAQAAAAAGLRVALHDPDALALKRALARVRDTLDRGVALGKVADATRQRVSTNLGAAATLEAALVGADLVIEAVPESLDLKRRVLADVEPRLRDDALLATNTSSLSIAALAEGLARPQRFLGLHFFNPVHVMALVEVVWGPATSVVARETGAAFARRLGKEPIVVKDSPGFASSRLGVLLGLEAMRMVEAGVASAADIDRAMELGYRHPMGPLRLTDLIGLDVRLGIAEYLHQALGSEAFRPPELLRRMVAEGRTGKKVGEGFYRWDEEGGR